MKPQSIKLESIRTDAGTQSRCVICNDVVADYSERMLGGEKFPPVDLFLVGGEYILTDGFHRVLASQMAGFKDVLSNIYEGTFLDALKASISANKSHGLRRTNADKRHSVWNALKNFGNLSDRAISDMAGVSADLVAVIRKEYSQLSENDSSTRIGRDGKERKMPTPKEKTEPPPSQSEPASAHEPPKTLDHQFKAAVGLDPNQPAPKMEPKTVLAEFRAMLELIRKLEYDYEQEKWLVNHMECDLRIFWKVEQKRIAERAA